MFPIDFKQNKDILVHTIEEYTSLISICFFFSNSEILVNTTRCGVPEAFI